MTTRGRRRWKRPPPPPPAGKGLPSKVRHRFGQEIVANLNPARAQICAKFPTEIIGAPPKGKDGKVKTRCKPHSRLRMMWNPQLDQRKMENRHQRQSRSLLRRPRRLRTPRRPRSRRWRRRLWLPPPLPLRRPRRSPNRRATASSADTWREIFAPLASTSFIAPGTDS